MRLKVMSERMLLQKIDLFGYDRPGWINIRSTERFNQSIPTTHRSFRYISRWLYMGFEDLDAVQGSVVLNSGTKGIKLFDDLLAVSVLDFIRLGNFDFLLINCEAGIRRSASIAATLAEIRGDLEACQKFRQFPYRRNALIEDKLMEWKNVLLADNDEVQQIKAEILEKTREALF